MGEELIPAGDASPFLALRMEKGELMELIQDTIGAEGLSPSDLDRVKVPSGGGTMWEIPTVDGDTEGSKTLKGVIIAVENRRAYWSTKYSGQNDPPDCASFDGVTGEGEPGGSCIDCPLNVFGTASDEAGNAKAGKACQERRLLFILPEDSIIPLMLNIPPASIAGVKKYRVRLLRGQQRLTDVVTAITLSKEKSGDGIEFSKVEFSRAATLDPAAAAQMRQYAEAISGAVSRVAVERED